MRRITIHTGTLHESIYFEGQFWWGLWEQHERSDYIVENASGESFRMPHPKKMSRKWCRPSFVTDVNGELCLSYYDTTHHTGIGWLDEHVALNVKTRQDAELGIGEMPPSPNNRYTGMTEDDKAAQKVHNKWQKELHALHLDRRTALDRKVAYTDTHVVMTGMEAVKGAPIVMGPTNAASVVATKGIRRNHIVIYERGGAARVMKISKEDNPIGLIMSGDGLTVLCECSNALYIIDLD